MRRQNIIFFLCRSEASLRALSFATLSFFLAKFLWPKNLTCFSLPWRTGIFLFFQNRFFRRFLRCRSSRRSCSGRQRLRSQRRRLSFDSRSRSGRSNSPLHGRHRSSLRFRDWFSRREHFRRRFWPLSWPHIWRRLNRHFYRLFSRWRDVFFISRLDWPLDTRWCCFIFIRFRWRPQIARSSRKFTPKSESFAHFLPISERNIWK